MTHPALTIEALPAGYGDTVLLSCQTHAGEWRMLVDCGPDECWPSLNERLSRLPLGANGKRHIDLAIISHIDHDHIGAAHALFDDRSLGLSFGDIWFNAPPVPMKRGVAEGRSLALLLGAAHSELPWNQAWGGKSAVASAQSPFVELPAAPGMPRLTLLSPTPETLATLFKVWDQELRKLGHSEAPEPARGAARGAEPLDLEAMAGQANAPDHAPANGSSIALLVEHEGRSVLLGADAYAPVLVAALQALATHRKTALPWQFDVFKLSHHGSRANISSELFGALQARHYIVSTNGAIFGHPDKEAIARVVVHGGAKRQLWFNYRSEHTERWDSKELQQRYGYTATLPASGPGEVSISLDRAPARH